MHREISLPSGMAETQGGRAEVFVAVRRIDLLPEQRQRSLLRAQQSRAARRLLEQLLRTHWGGRADGWTLQKTSTGRPRLLGQGAPHISIAHSGEWVACALAQDARVGVDIEILRPHDWHGFAALALHGDEARWVLAAEGRERDVRGLLCWCRKEALMKASHQDLGRLVLKDLVFSPAGEPVSLPTLLGGARHWHHHSEIVADSAVVSAMWQ